MNNYFYVDTDDEITSVIGKIREEETEEIFLVVPKRALIAQSLVNLRLLDKEAKKYKKKLVFVSPDAHIRKLAEKAGLAVKKYLAKPKEKKKPDQSGREEALTLTPKPRKLEPWEEEAAKRELASIIKKDDEKKPAPELLGVIGVPELVEKRTLVPGTKIPVGAFGKPSNAITRKIPKRSTEVVDLKKAQLHRKNIPFIQREVKPISSKRQDLLPKLPKKKTLFSKKEALPQENLAPKQHRGAAKATVNPFRVRKLEKNASYPVSNAQSSKIPDVGSRLNPPASRLGKEPENSREYGSEFSPKAGPPVAENSESALEKNHDQLFSQVDRETASLTLKEKEKLRDLWMEQKGVVRGKYIKSNTSLDLAATKKESGEKEKVFSQSSGLFKTTHRQVGSPGKIVNLRLNPGRPSELSQAETGTKRSNSFLGERGEFNQQKGRNVVLLPLINIKFFSLFVLIIILALAIIVGIIIPDARVVIKSNVNKDDLVMNFWVSGEVSQIDLNEHLIPGKPVHFKITEEKSFPTTGSREIKENGQGQVIIYNKTGHPLSLKQNALLVDSAGKKFYTQVPVLVPAGEVASDNGNLNSNTNSSTTEIKAGSVVAAVKAEGTGKEYNLKEGAILTIPGLADSEFSGGVTAEIKKEIIGDKSRTVKIVTKEDIEKAKNELLNKAQEDSRGELEKNLASDNNKTAKPDALSVEDVTYTSSKAEGEEADSFNLNLAATFFTVAFSREDLERLSKDIVESNSSVSGGSVTMNDYSLADSKPLENKVGISASLNYQKTSELDVNEIRRQLVAKKKNEAEEFLRGNKDIEQYTLNLWPGWPARLPLLERRIKVEIQQ